MAEKMKLGLVGLGQRGSSLLEGIFIPSERVEVAAVCDIYDDRIEKAVSRVTEAGQKRPLPPKTTESLLTRIRLTLW